MAMSSMYNATGRDEFPKASRPKYGAKGTLSGETGRDRMKGNTRTKSGDTSKMNKVYKPKSSPGPVSQLGTYQTGKKGLEQRGTYQTGQGLSVKKTYQTGSGVKEVYKSKSTTAASKPKAKSKNVAGFKPGSIGAKAITSFKKAYQGK
jgi:hypothetical protein